MRLHILVVPRVPGCSSMRIRPAFSRIFRWNAALEAGRSISLAISPMIMLFAVQVPQHLDPHRGGKCLPQVIECLGIADIVIFHFQHSFLLVCVVRPAARVRAAPFGAAVRAKGFFERGESAPAG